MISNKVKERLLKKNWRITCKTQGEASLVLLACDEVGIKWASEQKATKWDLYAPYPLYIEFSNVSYGITRDLSSDYKGDCIDITDWFFNAIKNNDSKLTPQNAEQEHWVQIILARLQGIPIEVYSIINNKWIDLGDDCLIFMGYKYRIKSKPTPLPISREIWSHLNKRWRYATMDRDGQTFWHQEKPTKTYLGWYSVDSISMYPLNFNSEGINWETSLTERPEDV